MSLVDHWPSSISIERRNLDAIGLLGEAYIIPYSSGGTAGVRSGIQVSFQRPNPLT